MIPTWVLEHLVNMGEFKMRKLYWVMTIFMLLSSLGNLFLIKLNLSNYHESNKMLTDASVTSAEAKKTLDEADKTLTDARAIFEQADAAFDSATDIERRWRTIIARCQ